MRHILVGSQKSLLSLSIRLVCPCTHVRYIGVCTTDGWMDGSNCHLINSYYKKVHYSRFSDPIRNPFLMWLQCKRWGSNSTVLSVNKYFPVLPEVNVFQQSELHKSSLTFSLKSNCNLISLSQTLTLSSGFLINFCTKRGLWISIISSIRGTLQRDLLSAMNRENDYS